MDVRLVYKYASGIVKLNTFFIYIHFIFINTKLKSYIFKPILKKQEMKLIATK